MEAPDPTYPNDRLRQERIRRNWRQNEVADKIGTTVVTVNRWERGNQQPSAYFRVKLCRLFEKNAEELGLLPTKIEPIDGEAQQIIHSSNEQVHATSGPSQQVSTPQNQNRTYMLRRLYRSYSDLLTQSLQGAVWIELGLSQKPDVVQNAANLLLHTPNGREQPFPPGTSILEVYDEAEHELLILGAPGAGKSTLLLDLAQRLLARAEQDDMHPLPIILPLSLWAVKKSSLQDWACEQLIEIYDVPLRVSEQWMQEEKILLLLDGLDEMEASARQACIAAINTYHHDHLVPLVVCSRTTEYDLATKHHRLALQRAVVVQPLTELQVDTYLDTLSTPQVALRQALQGNPTLRELATTPLMLNVLLLTYQDTPTLDLPAGRDQMQQNIWTDYVQRMVIRKGDTKRYPPQKTCSWLGWLARQMRAHNTTVFYLEHLQPDWLETWQQKIYAGLAILLPGILIGILASLLVRFFFSISDTMPLLLQGILGGLLGGIFSNTTTIHNISPRSPSVILKRLALNVSISVFIGAIYGWSDQFSRVGYNVQQGYISGPIIGLCSLLLLYLLPSLHPQRSHQENNHVVWPWQFLFCLMGTLHGRRALVVAAILGGGTALINGLTFGLQVNQGFKMIIGLSLGLNLGFISALSFGLTSILISLILTTQAEGIQLAERLRWSWRSLLKSLLRAKHCRTTILLTISIILIDGLAFGLSNGLIAGLISGVSIGLPVGVLGGLNNGLMLGLIGGISNGLSTGLSFGLSYWLLFGLVQGISSERVDDQDRRDPNQGIRHSIRNSLLLGMISGILIGFIGWLGFVLNFWLNAGIFLWLMSGLINKPLNNSNLGLNSIELSFILNIVWFIAAYGGLLACAINGGLAAWRHAVIRLLLWRTYTFPWKAPQFLNDATARILLRRVGGGYSFMHRVLLDYFADN